MNAFRCFLEAFRVDWGRAGLTRHPKGRRGNMEESQEAGKDRKGQDKESEAWVPTGVVGSLASFIPP